MSIPIVVTGATGRMGSTIIGFVQKDPELELAGVVERPTCVAALDKFVCTKGSSLDEVLPQAKGALIIDFTAPEATLEAAKVAAKHGNPLVAGTTGLNPHQVKELEVLAKAIPLLWSPNMSIGVNVLLKVLPELVRLLGEPYDMEMVELHHNQKKDAPSGTALKIAECLAKARGWELEDTGAYCRHGIIGARPKKEIGVQTIRGGDVVGVHTVYFMGPGERIEVTHQAHTRDNFAQGAVRAAKWLASQPAGRLYGYGDLL